MFKPIAPTTMAKWLGLVYAIAVLLFLLRGADAPDIALSHFLLLPWLVGPAALAAIGVKLSQSERGAWTFFALEAMIIGSTAWVWTYLIVIEPDAQNGIAMLLFPVVQYAAVLLFFLIAKVFGWRSKKGGTHISDG